MNSRKYIYFYSRTAKAIEIIPSQVIWYLKKHYKINNIVVIFSDKYLKNFPKNLPEDSLVFHEPVLNKKRINRISSSYPPSQLVVIAQSIPDMFMLSVFNKMKVSTILIQHGLMVPFLERISILSLLFKKFKKIMIYLYCALGISRIYKLSTIRILAELFKIFITGNENIANSKELIKANVNARSVLCFDKSWADFFVSNFGYKKNQIAYVGSPDLMMLKEIKKHEKEDAICYICQTLVEDDRYPKKKFLRFIHLIDECLPENIKLYIKFHPRSNRELYKALFYRKNVILTSDFPNCTKYLGHYSSMLALAYQCSPFIFLWDFVDHRIPQYFKQFGYYIDNRKIELIKFFKEDFSNRKCPQNYHQMADNEISEYNPIKKISEFIVKKQ